MTHANSDPDVDLGDWDRCVVAASTKEHCMRLAGCAWCHRPNAGCFSYSYCDARIVRKTLAFLPSNACMRVTPSPRGSCEWESQATAVFFADVFWTVLVLASVCLCAVLVSRTLSIHNLTAKKPVPQAALGVWIVGVLAVTMSSEPWPWCKILACVLSFVLATPLVLWMLARLSSVGLAVYTYCLKPILAGEIGGLESLQASVIGILWMACLFLVPVFSLEALTTAKVQPLSSLGAVISAALLAFLLLRLERILQHMLPFALHMDRASPTRSLLDEQGLASARSGADDDASDDGAEGDKVHDGARAPDTVRWAAVLFMSFLLGNCILFYLRVGNHMFWMQLANVGVFSMLLWDTNTADGLRRNLPEGRWEQHTLIFNVALQVLACSGLVIHLFMDVTSNTGDIREAWGLGASLVIAVACLAPFAREIIEDLIEMSGGSTEDG